MSSGAKVDLKKVWLGLNSHVRAASRARAKLERVTFSNDSSIELGEKARLILVGSHQERILVNRSFRVPPGQKLKAGSTEELNALIQARGLEIEKPSLRSVVTAVVELVHPGGREQVLSRFPERAP